MGKKYCIYMHICPNNKKYIGITSLIPKKRWNYGRGYKYSVLFFKAIQKYGWDNIKHKILLNNLTKEEACKKEQELISLYKSNNPKYGYNITNGGNTTITFTDEIKKKISINTKKAMKNPLVREKLREHRKHQVSPMKGKKLSEEHKSKLKHDGMKGKHHTEESKKLMRQNIKRKRKVLCVETNIIYESMCEASRQTGIDYRNIHRCCNKGTTAKGFHWKYINNKEEK